MNDHNLDDLVIDIEPNKSHAKTKNPLTLFALVIIILILGIIFNKNFHQDDENAEVLEENMSDFIAPELQLQNAHDTELSNLEEIQTEDMTSPESEEVFSLKKLIENKPKTPLEKMRVIEMPISPRQRTATQENTATTTHKAVETPVKEELTQTIDESIDSKTVKVEKKEAKKKEIKKTIVKKQVHKKVSKKPSVSQTHNTTVYYIQVGAFKHTPSKRLLSVITSTGFKYLISQANSTATKKLLIGPYHDKASVNKALSTVQTRINKSAYVIRK